MQIGRGELRANFADQSRESANGPPSGQTQPQIRNWYLDASRRGIKMYYPSRILGSIQGIKNYNFITQQQFPLVSSETTCNFG